MYAKNVVLRWLVRAIRRVVPYNSRIFRCLYKTFVILTAKSKLKIKSVTEIDIQIHPADHCNLCCRGCNTFSPLAKECFADLEVMKRDIKRLAELTGGKVGSLTISGGEPLLYPRLPELLEYSRKAFPYQKIEVITNGILLETAPEELWMSFRENSIIISLTHYPISIDIDKIKMLVKKNSVDFIYQDDTDIRIKTMYFSPLDPSGSRNISESYKYCFMANYCFVIESGKLYTCPTVAHIKYFNEYFNQNFEVSDSDYIDIYKAKNINEILTFFCKPMPFCRYCNKKERVSGLPWDVSKREISEWM